MVANENLSSALILVLTWALNSNFTWTNLSISPNFFDVYGISDKFLLYIMAKKWMCEATYGMWRWFQRHKWRAEK